MDNNLKIFTPLKTPAFTLNNRIVMAPMSRRRSPQGTPSASVAIYYGQRASAGLIITENVAVSQNGVGYLDAPAMFNEEQKEALKKIVETVHEKEGKIFMQLVHSGRVGHHFNHKDNAELVAPSPIKASGLIKIPTGEHLEMPEPIELSTEDAENLIDSFVDAAKTAIELGYDGVEIHGAHGFLTEQFLNPHTNLRKDKFGGSVKNRTRFLLEIAERTAKEIGPERTGIRLSPFAGVNEMAPYSEELETYQYLIDNLNTIGLLYVHLSGFTINGKQSITEDFIRDVRARFKNLVMLAGDYTKESAEIAIENGLADLVAFGRPFISNPDLVNRFKNNLPLAVGDEETFYKGGDYGYIDYPTA
ncbi:alkene reductase [Chryseobacterium artocarpi]|uniref:Alkene reductase n=1 Tax=Chryseobacterium artocarpi TaxID=1414727 RepID=A0A1B8ZBY4_9FLAO|nr:alkene reductase [Chryseobacterium artocarpi]OCA69095.1 alkene reductase [Chryseobacterium artocarpi]